MRRLSVWDERRVPRDVRQYVRRRVLRRVIPCVLMMALFLGALIAFDDVFFGEVDKPFRVQSQAIGYLLAAVVPMLITGCPLKLLGSSWEGEVVKVHAYTSIQSRAVLRPSHHDLFLQLRIQLTVRMPDGRTVRRLAMVAPAKEKSILGAFRVGDRVLHLYGTDHTVVLPESSADPCGCVICGRKNKDHRGRCACGYSLVL